MLQIELSDSDVLHSSGEGSALFPRQCVQQDGDSCLPLNPTLCPVKAAVMGVVDDGCLLIQAVSVSTMWKQL